MSTVRTIWNASSSNFKAILRLSLHRRGAGEYLFSWETYTSIVKRDVECCSLDIYIVLDLEPRNIFFVQSIDSHANGATAINGCAINNRCNLVIGTLGSVVKSGGEFLVNFFLKILFPQHFFFGSILDRAIGGEVPSKSFTFADALSLESFTSLGNTCGFFDISVPPTHKSYFCIVVLPHQAPRLKPKPTSWNSSR